MGEVMTTAPAMAVRDALAAFRMPLFFFVSGYFSYRVAKAWTGPKLRSVLGKKVCAQLLGTALFASAFAYCFGHDVVHVLSDLGGWGFWFCIVLFQMFLLYVAVMLATRKAPRWVFFATMIAVTAVVNYFFFTEVRLPRFTMGELTHLGWPKLCFYMPYFTLGLFARALGDRFQTLLGNRWFTLAVVSLFIASELFLPQITAMGRVPASSMAWRGYIYLPGLTGVLTLTALFYRLRGYFERGGRLSRTMTFVGGRTLDIYFLHWFFLPNLHFIPAQFYGANPAVPMLLVGLLVAIPVMACALGVSGLLRTSPLLARLLFAAPAKPAASAISAASAPAPLPGAALSPAPGITNAPPFSGVQPRNSASAPAPAPAPMPENRPSLN